MLLSATSSTQNLNHPRTLLLKIPSPNCDRLSHLLLATLPLTPYNPTTSHATTYYHITYYHTTLLLTPLLLTTLLLTTLLLTTLPLSLIVQNKCHNTPLFLQQCKRTVGY